MGDTLKHLELPEEAAVTNAEVFTMENLLPAFTHGRHFHSGLECSNLKHEEPLCTWKTMWEIDHHEKKINRKKKKILEETNTVEGARDFKMLLLYCQDMLT